MRASLALLALVAGCSVTEAQTAPRPNAQTACQVDADCVVVDRLPSCSPCGSCAGELRAIARRYVDTQRDACDAERARRDAARRGRPSSGAVAPNCAPCTAPPAPTPGERPVAVCRADVCALAPAPAPR